MANELEQDIPEAIAETERSWAAGEADPADQELLAEVVRRLHDDPLLDDRFIHVEVISGEVMLTGHVPGFADITLAQNQALQAAGVTAVHPQLEVQQPEVSQDKLARDDKSWPAPIFATEGPHGDPVIG